MFSVVSSYTDNLGRTNRGNKIYFVNRYRLFFTGQLTIVVFSIAKRKDFRSFYQGIVWGLQAFVCDPTKLHIN